MNLDYTMNVTPEIQEMAMKIEDYFISRGIHKWAVMNICSRNHINEIENLRNKLINIKTEIDK